LSRAALVAALNGSRPAGVPAASCTTASICGSTDDRASAWTCLAVQVSSFPLARLTATAG